MFGSFIRNKAFWILDFLKGGQIKKFYQQVKSDMESNNSDDDRIIDIIKYAEQEVPFYKQYTTDRLEELPVMNKKIYMADFDSFIGCSYREMNLHTVSTSGSTGYRLSPFKIKKKEKSIRQTLYIFIANAVVNPSAKIGKHCIINTGAIVEHDNVLGDYVHLSPNATLTGGATVGECTHIGAGASTKQVISITNNCVIGAGASVVKDITESGTYVGVPARKMK